MGNIEVVELKCIEMETVKVVPDEKTTENTSREIKLKTMDSDLHSQDVANYENNQMLKNKIIETGNEITNDFEKQIQDDVDKVEIISKHNPKKMPTYEMDDIMKAEEKYIDTKLKPFKEYIEMFDKTVNLSKRDTPPKVQPATIVSADKKSQKRPYLFE